MSEIPYDPGMEPGAWTGQAPGLATTTTSGATAPGAQPPTFDQPTFNPPWPQQPAPVTGLGEPGAPYSPPGPYSPPADAQPGSAAGPQAPAADPLGELGPLLAKPGLLTLVDGTQIRVKPLKTRELLALLAIAIGQVGPQMMSLKLNPDEPAEIFMAKFAGLLFSAFPYSQDEILGFIRMVCEPVGKVTEGRIDKAVKARNDALDRQLDQLLDNPEPDDTITIIETIITGNAGDLQTWGKRLAGIFRLAMRTGQIPASPTSQA